MTTNLRLIGDYLVSFDNKGGLTVMWTKGGAMRLLAQTQMPQKKLITLNCHMVTPYLLCIHALSADKNLHILSLDFS